MRETMKMIFLGDRAVGKTCLIITYGEGTFPQSYIPMMGGSRVVCETVDSTSFNLCFCDTYSSEEHDKLRPLAYPHTDVFLVCFSIDKPDSLENVKKKWYPEVRHHCPTTPIVLVGTKLDLRNDGEVIEDLKSRGLRPVTTEQALEIKEEIGAWSYVECSSLTKENLEYVFDEAIQAVLNAPEPKKKKKCTII